MLERLSLIQSQPAPEFLEKSVRHCIKRVPTGADAGTINQPQSLMTRAFDLGENRTGRYLHLLLGLLFLAFGALNALAAENPEKAAVGLGEVLR